MSIYFFNKHAYNILCFVLQTIHFAESAPSLISGRAGEGKKTKSSGVYPLCHPLEERGRTFKYFV
jgi:hypothetical protein